MKSTVTFQIITFIIVFVSPCVHLAPSSDTPTTHPSSYTLNKHIRTKRHNNEPDFEPRFIHQPHSVEVRPKKPHTVECPVEAQPEAEVKWFKDDQLVESEPTHLEQTGSELMFFQINEQDSGDYHCQATNYLGSITSKPFKIIVLSTVHDANIRLEPQLAEVDWSLTKQPQSIELTCTIPLSYLSSYRSSLTATKSLGSQLAELVSWRKDGRLLPVVWRGDEEEAEQPPTRSNNNNNNEADMFSYEARQKSANEFVLVILQQYKTSTSRPNMQTIPEVTQKFTCAYRGPFGPEQAEDELAHESNGSKVTVWLPKQTLGSDIDMAPPINDLANTSGPNHLNINQTTQLRDPTIVGTNKPRHVSSLVETLRDLVEIVRPTLLIFAILCLILLVLLLQFTFIRRKNRENMRYMKHHQFHHHHAATMSAGSSGGSGASSALGGSLDCDPVLSSLLSRTLSGPSAGSLTGVGKKYKSYRDHMRKVAAANELVSSNNPDLFLDVANGGGYLANAALVSSNSNHSDNHEQHQHQPAFSFASSAILPNLYNQSLAAREQARSLLHHQPNEHMRSLSNLSGQAHQTSGGQDQQQQPGISQQNFARTNGSHLNLPLAFAFESNQHQTGGPLEAGASQLLNQHSAAIWPPHLLQMVNRNQQQSHKQQQQQQLPARQQDNEHYQLVSCSSISPSSSSSSAGIGRNSPSTGQQHARENPGADQMDSQRPMKPLPRESTNSSNHYSIIETNDEDDRYEVLGTTTDQDDTNHHRSSSRGQPDHMQRNSHRISTFISSNVTVDNQAKSGQHQIRSSIKSSNSSSTSGCGDSTGSSSITGDPFTRFGSKRGSRGAPSQPLNQRDKQNKYQDQLSPYAVSSICGGLPGAPLPPPVNSEAMRALKEQFDINQLMLVEDPVGANSHHPSLPFNPPPPPSPPARS